MQLKYRFEISVYSNDAFLYYAQINADSVQDVMRHYFVTDHISVHFATGTETAHRITRIVIHDQVLNTNTTTVTSLEDALAIVQEMDEIASAIIYTPSESDAADLRANGIEPRSTLEVTVWRSHRNPTDVRCAIESLGMEMVGDGDSINGKCYSFALRE